MADYDLSHLAVLIIDDNAHMRTILRTILRGFGVRKISEAADAFRGLEELKAANIDLILLDYAMDKLDGIEFAQLVRRSEDSVDATVPIIMVSAYTERSRIERARDVGIDEFLCKPVCAAVLYERIAQILSNPRVFVRKDDGFTGPDRRRKSLPASPPIERRVGEAKTTEKFAI